MIFIVNPTDQGTIVNEWPDATPSDCKAFRQTGHGFTVRVPNRSTLDRTILPRYPQPVIHRPR